MSAVDYVRLLRDSMTPEQLAKVDAQFVPRPAAPDL
jgi:hypothetical protein